MGTVDLIDAAKGRRPADLILVSARIAVLHTGEVLEGDVAITGDRIVGVGTIDAGLRGRETDIVDVEGAVVAPGLFDPHFHVGGSHLGMTELARALLPLGTTSIATDCQEAYTYAGPAGVRAFIDEARDAGLRAFLIPSVHVLGLETVGTFRWPVSGSDMAEMVGWPEAIGINEPPPGPVLGQHPGVIEAIEATKGLGKKLPGHAPGIHGTALQAYIAAGFDADHESTTSEQALEKLRLGMQVMARQGSASPDLAALLPLISSHPAAARFTMLCSDEEDPKDLVEHGHLDEKLRMCVRAGIDAVTALQMASLNAATYFGLDRLLGSVTPGKLADLVVFDDLVSFRPRLVLSGGRIVVRDGRMVTPRVAHTVPDILRSRVDVPRPFEPDDFRIPADGDAADVRVISVADGTLVSGEEVRSARVVDGAAQADPSTDLLKLAVIDRHSDALRLGRGFVSGFGFRAGAVATTYCHVHYDLLSLGTSDEELAHAANVVREMGGGMAVVRGGEVLARWELPIVGIFTTETLHEAKDAFVTIGDAIRSLGCPLAAPVLALSFVALPTIPALGLTDRGLIDVATQSFVDVVIPARVTGGSM
jgi:adenine deaminase